MKKRDLILHVGMPKTASSSFQFWADNHRQYLLDAGVDYPASPRNEATPKHQDLVSDLFSAKVVQLSRYLANAKSQKMLLSTEGLSNHFYDFPRDSFIGFRDALRDWAVTIVMVIRPAEDWINSYWKQCLVNPRVPKYYYGTSLRRHEFSELPRIQRMLDHPRFFKDIGNGYGADSMIIADQSGDWFDTFRKLLALPSSSPAPDRIHLSMSDDLAEIVRQLNSFDLHEETRLACLALIQHSLSIGHTQLMSYAMRYQPHALSAMAGSLKSSLQGIMPVSLHQEELIECCMLKLQSISNANKC